MNQKFVGGLYRPIGSNSDGPGMDIGVPWILLIPTEEQLEFRIRLGLQRFFGPWTIERQNVAKVFRMRRGLTFPWSVPRIEGQQDLQWTQVDGKTKTTTYAEDALGRVASATDPLNRTTLYTHDATGATYLSFNPTSIATSLYDSWTSLTTWR